MKQRLYVSGYWPLIGNQKRSQAYYEKLLPSTFSALQGQQLVFCSSSSILLEQMQEMSKKFQISMQPMLLPVDRLPGWDLSKDLADCCVNMKLDQWTAPNRFYGEKGVTHYWRDYKQSGYSIYRSMLAIWLSKVYLVERIASQSSCQYFAWVDASIARFCGQRTNWRYWLLPDDPFRVSHYAGLSRYYGRRLPLNASFLSASKSSWGLLSQAFSEVAKVASLLPYGHDEETIMSECVRSSPHLFRCIGKPYEILSRKEKFMSKIKAFKDRLKRC